MLVLTTSSLIQKVHFIKTANTLFYGVIQIFVTGEQTDRHMKQSLNPALRMHTLVKNAHEHFLGATKQPQVHFKWPGPDRLGY